MTVNDNTASMSSAIQTGVDSALKEVHTCLPGIVTKFTAATQLVDVQVSIQRKLGDDIVNIPLLTDVPIRYPKCSTFSITFPLAVNDEVMLIFAERSIDIWLESGGIKDPSDVRRHSFSDAFAIPMMYNQGSAISSFDTTNLQIRTTSGNGITITPSGEIQLNGSTDTLIAYTNMKIAFDALVTWCNAHIHSDPVSGVTSAPTVQSTADMSGAEVSDVKVT